MEKKKYKMLDITKEVKAYLYLTKRFCVFT